MKKFLFLVLALALVIGGTNAKASVRFGGGIHSGVAMASFPDPLNDYYGLGYGVGLNGDVDIIEPLALRLNLDYSRFSSDKDKLQGQFSVTDGAGNPLPFETSGLDATLFSVTGNAIGRIPTGSAVRPYGILGLGLHILSASNLKIVSGGQTLLDQSAGETETRFGLNFGAGTEFLIGSAKLFVEAKYVLILTENSTSTIPITVGVAF